MASYSISVLSAGMKQSPFQDFRLTRIAFTGPSMDEMSARDVLKGPSVCCAVMLALGLIFAAIADIELSSQLIAYFTTAISATIMCVLLATFWLLLRLAMTRADDPLGIVMTRFKERLPFLILPCLIFPLFLAAFTVTKTAIPFIVGYRWDAFFANADRIVFGDDAWRITHRWFGTGTMVVWQWFYTVAWGFVLVFVKVLIALNARPSRVAVFYTAMMATWLLGGVVLAYALSSAGPVFAYLVDPDLAPRFFSLQNALHQNLLADAPIRSTQRYLSGSLNVHTAIRGGGISAMPSMHVGAASIYVLAARGTRWWLPAISFWAIVFIGSAYFGYHYWVDGIVAAGVAFICWALAEHYFEGDRQTYNFVVQPA